MVLVDGSALRGGGYCREKRGVFGRHMDKLGMRDCGKN